MIQQTNRKKRCKTWRCPNLHTNKWGYCDECTARYKLTHPELIYGTHPNKKENDRKYDETRPNFRQRGYSSEWTRFARAYLKKNPVCVICGAPARVCDHKDIPASVMMDAWGKFDYDESHYQALCVRCNNRKGLGFDKTVKEEYLAGKERMKEE